MLLPQVLASNAALGAAAAHGAFQPPATMTDCPSCGDSIAVLCAHEAMAAALMVVRVCV